MPDALVKIRYCESGGDYTAQNPTSSASGAYQFLDSTWRGIPGTSGYARAKFAPASVQDAAAIWLYQQAGTSPWLASQPCWSALGATPTTTLTHTGGGTGTSGSSTGTTSSGSSTTTTSTASESTATTVDAELLKQLPLTKGWTTFDYASPKLTKQDTAALAALTAAQKKQTWWTPQAKSGKTITRIVVTGGHPRLTHSAAKAWSESVGYVTDKDSLVGHYVNTDWFKVTSGAHAGEFVSTAFLARAADVKTLSNGKLDVKTQQCELPAYLLGATAPKKAYLNCTAAKQLVYLAAAARTTPRTALDVVDGYRSFDAQQALFDKFGAPSTAKAGESEHGLGVAAGLNTTTLSDKANSWLTANSRGFGWLTLHPDVHSSYVNYEFVG